MINKTTVRLIIVTGLATALIFCTTSSPGQGGPFSSSVPGLYTASELDELFRQWTTADGEAIFIVSDRFAFFLLGNPKQFYAGMAERPDAFQRWLGRLAGTTFTDYGGGCINRECLRTAMIRAVEKNDVDRPQLAAVRLRLLKALNETQISHVE